MSTIDITDYVPTGEVQRVCAELGLNDWTKLASAHVTFDDAETIRTNLGHEALKIPIEEFRHGLETELEHGLRFADANVTNNHPLLTGMIVLAHLKEMVDYYPRLRLAELEGDMFKAYVHGNDHGLSALFGQVLKAREDMARWESPTPPSASS